MARRSSKELQSRRERRRLRHEKRQGSLGLSPAVSSTGRAVAMGSGMLALLALFTSNWWLLAFAVLMALVSGAVAALPFLEQYFAPHVYGADGTRAQIGMGATVESGATIETGARVEMGATVRSGATIRSGAVVSMGSTVEENATLEADVRIGWGATVRKGALVKRGASIGAGAVVERDAVVPENARVGPGAVAASTGQRGAATPSADERDSRIDELCSKVESELNLVSPSLDGFLSQPRETLAKLRETCHDLLKRERELRRAANPAEQERLNRESTTLEARIAAETDEVTRDRLKGAVAAIVEQRRQRELLLRDANRLEAEQTRLVWTVEGLLAHVLRMRSSEAGNSRAISSELDQGIARLRDEVSAVAGAMDQVQALELGGPPEVAPTETRSPDRTRTT